MIIILLLIKLAISHELDGDYQGKWYTRSPQRPTYSSLTLLEVFYPTNKRCENHTIISDVYMKISYPIIDIIFMNTNTSLTSYKPPVRLISTKLENGIWSGIIDGFNVFRYLGTMRYVQYENNLNLTFSVINAVGSVFRHVSWSSDSIEPTCDDKIYYNIYKNSTPPPGFTPDEVVECVGGSYETSTFNCARHIEIFSFQKISNRTNVYQPSCTCKVSETPEKKITGLIPLSFISMLLW